MYESFSSDVYILFLCSRFACFINLCDRVYLSSVDILERMETEESSICEEYIC